MLEVLVKDTFSFYYDIENRYVILRFLKDRIDYGDLIRLRKVYFDIVGRKVRNILIFDISENSDFTQDARRAFESLIHQMNFVAVILVTPKFYTRVREFINPLLRPNGVEFKILSDLERAKELAKSLSKSFKK